jgi:molecular chaperone DnaK (HSP70)
VDVCSHSLGVGVAEDSRSIDENFRKVARKFGILNSVSEDQLQRVLGDRVDEFQKELRGLLRVAPIIHRNSALPSKRSEFFNTLYENQAAVQVIVVQGEGETVGENRFIGAFMFPLKQPCPAASQCEIQLTYDQNGMIHVLAKQLKTDNQAEAVFDSRTGEVTGWVNVSDLNGDRPDELQAQADETVQTAAPAEMPHRQNAFLVKAKRQLMRTQSGSEKHGILSSIIDEYEKLLEQTARGEDCDDGMDALEAEYDKNF